MRVIRISDLSPNGVLDFDLKDLLSTLGARAATSVWAVGEVASEDEALFATGDGAADLENLASSGERISGARLADIAKSVRQVVWGEFRGYDDGLSAAPWVVLIAFDSTRWEVQCSDASLLDQVGGAFKCVKFVDVMPPPTVQGA